MTDVNFSVPHSRQKNQMKLCPQVAVPQQDELQQAHSPIAPLSAGTSSSSSMCQWESASSKQCRRRTAIHSPPAERSTGSRRSSARSRHPRTSTRSGRSKRKRCMPSSTTTTTPTSSACRCSSRCSFISSPVDASAHQTKGSRRRRSHLETLPIQGMAVLRNGVIQAAIHQEEALDQEEALGQEEQIRHRHLPHLEEVQAEVQDQVQCRGELHPSSQEEEQELQGLLHLHLQALHNHHDLLIHGVHLIDPGKHLPKLMLPSNYKACSILEMRQLLESWYDRCTFAIATRRGDAQKYWLDEIFGSCAN